MYTRCILGVYWVKCICYQTLFLWHQGLSECVSNFNIYCVDTHVCLLHVFLVFFWSLPFTCIQMQMKRYILAQLPWISLFKRWFANWLDPVLLLWAQSNHLWLLRYTRLLLDLLVTTQSSLSLCSVLFSSLFLQSEDKTFLDLWKLKAASVFC